MNKVPILMCRLRNFGDSLNEWLIPKLSGKEVIPMNKVQFEKWKQTNSDIVYSCIGSILGWAGDKQIEVWGSGFISNSQTITSINAPGKIYAIRGPNTRDILLNKGYKCPSIFGDPAIVMSKFYSPKLPKKYKLSIIPHHIDKILIPRLKKDYPEAHFIDITGDLFQFINEIIQSEHIISSALHGCIMAWTYNIPYEWKEFSNKVLGNGFKFKDWSDSVPYLDANKLLNVCPFKRKLI